MTGLPSVSNSVCAGQCEGSMADRNNFIYIADPLKFSSILWPKVEWYKQQIDIIYSVEYNVETFVAAGNQLGKDFVSAFLALRGILRPGTCRVVTTSVKDDHLRVLWGEIGRFIDTCRYPLSADKGGPLVINHRDIRKVVRGEVCKISYLRGMVSEKGEGMAGHHANYTLGIIDEASGVANQVYTQMDTWAHRKLVIGNTNDTTNFFKEAIKGGDILKGAA